MTVGVNESTSEVVEEDSGGEVTVLASWWARAGAFAVDVLLSVAVLAVLGQLGYAARDSRLLWVYATAATLVGAAAMANRWLLPSLTGWTLGRSLFAIRVYRGAAPAGLGRLILRDLAHGLDTLALFLGWLWPLWDSGRRTFADVLLRTDVRVVDPPRRDTRGRAAAALLVAVLLSGGAVGLSYGLQFRHDRAIDQARQQISEQGPRIVERVLSYNVDSMQKDFEQALTLVADNYRDQIVKQQQSAGKHPTTNQYYAVSSAVLEPMIDPDRASMLVALRGQRGVDAKTLQFSTATVRAEFVRSPGDRWQLANLTVLKRPQGGA